ncbi:acyltransferase family protein [Enterococcus faecium]|uniref:acyltransferase family protein n=1 Tax=Enterococcus faecium TaxID=1352 RepID=UPI0018ABFED6|nr:acyltransferase family protein [Enterococcus faecium]MDB7359555.1 acyltransferase family protein [Enterococcus faecium]MDB7377638.1 acyltransferase family protein [Enterococcus faecium]MDB7380244.1 acyltransferase family protein [Enterococcus faecium]MDB7385393.1 acyltransferase family protein [Enterococcus faecium]MDB7387651.1 acyltransferase family protein [Enterococcus faecium]
MKKIYSKEIDCFRGIAVLAVIFYHLPNSKLPGGLQGVTIFFVVSGFLMAKNTIRDEKNRQFSFLHFYYKRIKRIYPFLLFSLVVSIFILGISNIRLIGNIRSELPSLIFGYNNWWQLNQGVSYFESYFNASLFKHYWSLSVELQFYLIWPFLFIVMKRMRRKQVFYLIYTLIFVSIHFSLFLPSAKAYYHTVAKLFPFLLGVWGYFNRITIGRFFEQNSFSKIWLLLLASLCLILFPIFPYTLNELLISICFALLLASVDDVNIAKKTKIASTKLSFVGKISYELYLVHFPVLIALTYLFKHYHLKYLDIASLFTVFLCTLLMITFFRKGVQKMRSPKIWTAMALMIIGISVLVLRAPANRLTADQNQLQSLLKENSSKASAGENQLSQEKKILFIGDSVMLGAYQELKETFPKEALVDAKESRQITALPEILKKHKDLVSYQQIVIRLGTNGVLTDDAIEQTMSLLKDKKVYWVNIKAPTGWQETINATLAKLPNQYSNITMIDWYSESQNHPEFFYDDETHLNESGRTAYAKYIASVIQ